MSSSNTSNGSSGSYVTAANVNTSLNSLNTISNNYTISAGSFGNLYCKSIYSEIEYLSKELFQNEDISETTIRSILVDMKKAGKEDSIDFSTLLSSRELSEKFLNDFYDKFNKAELYRTQSVSLDFIKKHLNDVKDNEDACREICYRQQLTEEFIELFSDHVNWAGIASNKYIKFTVSFLLKYIDRFDDLALKSLCQNDSINTGVFNAFLEQLSDDIRYRLDWEAISWHKDLTEENILNNLDFIDFNSLLLATRKFKDDVITCFRKVKFGI